jgi:hypothetical protein
MLFFLSFFSFLKRHTRVAFFIWFKMSSKSWNPMVYGDSTWKIKFYIHSLKRSWQSFSYILTKWTMHLNIFGERYQNWRTWPSTSCGWIVFFYILANSGYLKKCVRWSVSIMPSTERTILARVSVLVSYWIFLAKIRRSTNHVCFLPLSFKAITVHYKIVFKSFTPTSGCFLKRSSPKKLRFVSKCNNV